MRQRSAHICDHGGGFVEAISFLAEKNCLTVSLIVPYKTQGVIFSVLAMTLWKMINIPTISRWTKFQKRGCSGSKNTTTEELCDSGPPREQSTERTARIEMHQSELLKKQLITAEHHAL